MSDPARMTDHDRYFLDLNGYLLLEGVLTPAEVDRLNEEVDDVKTAVDSVQLEIRGQPIRATESLIVCKSETLRVVTAVLPASSDRELVVFSFMGVQGTFDETTLKTFLASVR